MEKTKFDAPKYWQRESENLIFRLSTEILRILLQDKTTKKNIIWATPDYETIGEQYGTKEEILPELIEGEKADLIRPRSEKAKAVQEQRIKERAEVFTPSWICNIQNNLIDEGWFGRKDVFNVADGKTWKATTEKIKFGEKKQSWQIYVKENRLEITCGEAPYLVSRYDTTTGESISLPERIGLFDRKMRVVNENCEDERNWLEWSVRALKSTYGFEMQGDSLLLARMNLFYDYQDYFEEKFHTEIPIIFQKKLANIIAWNLWQMDGLRFTVPFTCHKEEKRSGQMLLDGTEEAPEITDCPGCESGDRYSHNGIYCKIFDWTNLKKSVLFIDVLRGKR